MKFQVLYFLLSLTTLNLVAENPTFSDYAALLGEYDVEVNIPEGFKVTTIERPYGLLALRTGVDADGVDLDLKYRQAAHPYKIRLESEDRDAIILLPEIPDPENVQIIKRGYYIESELRAVKNDTELDISNMIAPVCNTATNRYANADTVVIYDINMSSAGVKRYKYCTALYLRKFAHPALCVKLLFTECGKEKSEIYMDRLLSSINFGDNPNDILVKQEKNNSIKDLVFPQSVMETGTGIGYSKVDKALMSIFDKGGKEALQILMGDKSTRPYYALIRMHGKEFGLVNEVDSVLHDSWESGGREVHDTLMIRIKRLESGKLHK